MDLDDRHRLLHAPYQPPALQRGDRADCHIRGLVRITSWTDARIPWPKCIPIDCRSQPTLLVDDELARAVRHESAAAIMFWWGVGEKPVWKWRRELGVGRMDSQGSRRLILAAAQAGAEALKLNGLPDHICNLMSERAKKLNLIRFARAKPARPYWTAADLRVLDSDIDDAEAAVLTGRTETAVRVMRWRMVTGRK